jgi:hypothetical protein
MTDPRHAYNEPGRGRWYLHPVTGERWPSVTNVLDTAISKPALVPWAAKITAEKAWQVLPQMVAKSRKPAERELLHKEIKGEVRIVKDMAADLGDRVHKRAEAHVLGKPYPEDEEVEPFALQMLQFFSDFGVDFDKDIEASEATIINRTVGYAGTGDLWVWLRVSGRRRLLLLDIKTSSTRPAESVFTEMGLQLAALAKGETVLLDDGTEVDPPAPIHGTAILNLRAKNYALIPMPFDGDLDAAFTGFCGALQTAKYMHAHYGEKPTPMPKPIMKVAS